MASAAKDPTESYEWQPEPEAAQFVAEQFEACCARSSAVRHLAARMRDETGTRLIDWLDHLMLPAGAELERRLTQLGFVANGNDRGGVWQHPRGLFPAIRVHAGEMPGIGIKIESVSDFLFAQHLADDHAIDGQPWSTFRKARVIAEEGVELWAIERHGDRGFEPSAVSAENIRAALCHREAFRRRNRHWPDAEQGFDWALHLIRRAKADLGIDWSCDLFFSAERKYWQSRNRAAQVQKARQDRLGLGWANHDHHTYRSSREHFTRLVSVLEELGFICRERFYGGHGAGWGAQVLEQPAARIVIFADVDLTPEEVTGDFAHEPLPTRHKLGTVGLWCRLHGEAFLEAGMHHLECQFDFDAARDQLAQAGIRAMPPFTDFPHLKQAFTEGETWPVDPARIERALAERAITRDEAEKFRQSGAIGSHLEILERNAGYKGFNQTGINEIIHKTDPRGFAAGAESKR